MLIAILTALIVIGIMQHLSSEDVATIHPDRKVSLHMRRWKALGWKRSAPPQPRRTRLHSGSSALHRI